MIKRRLYIKSSPDLDTLESYKLFEQVIKKTKLKSRKPPNYLPVNYLYIVTDGHDILSFKKSTGEDSIFLVTHPEHKSILPKSVEFVLFNQRYSGLERLKKYFTINSSGNENDIQVIDSNIAIKLLDCIVIPKTLYVGSDDLVRFTPIKGASIGSLNLVDSLISLEYQMIPNVTFDDLSKYVLNSIFTGKINVPQRYSEGVFPEE